MKAARPLTFASFVVIAALAGCAHTRDTGTTTSSTTVTSPTASTTVTSPTASTTVTTPGSSTSSTGMGASAATGQTSSDTSGNAPLRNRGTSAAGTMSSNGPTVGSGSRAGDGGTR